MSLLNKERIDYFNNGKVENEKFWNRLGGKPNFKNKKVLDFGCGYGSLCVDIAKNNPNLVVGVDLEKENIKFANTILSKNYHELKEKVFFEEKNLLKENYNKKFDVIVTKDTFEHTENLPLILNKLHDLLEDGGKVYVGFGPLYNFFNGDHGRTQLKFPWLHVILSDQYIIKRYNKKNNNKIKKIQDLGLSKYSFNEYKNIFKKSKFKIEFFTTNKSDHPIGKFLNFFSKIKILEEFFTFNIYCILRK